MSSRAKAQETVRVVVRCRPLSRREASAGCCGAVDLDVKLGQVTVRNPRAGPSELPKSFTFDAVYDWNSKQADLYDETFRPLVESVLLGFNGTIFAYGQTGTGKTYTMEGPGRACGDPERRGVIPSSFEQIFTHISRSQNQQYLVRASYLEIYQEEIRDLLCKDQSQRLELKERPDVGVYVKELSSFVTKSVKEIEHVMNVGGQNRAVGATNMNERSSRSHAIFVVTVESSERGVDGQARIRAGKLNLVDLAGSERQAKTGAQGERLKEATKINLSLSALGNVISALVDGRSSHVPYRDSKLTRLLQDSLGGNAKTIMVATVGPADCNYDESLTTLRYASRAKNIKNKPRINEDPKDALLREFQEEISRLRAQLEKRSLCRERRRSRTSRRKSRAGGDGENNDKDDDGGDDDDDDDEVDDDGFAVDSAGGEKRDEAEVRSCGKKQEKREGATEEEEEEEEELLMAEKDKVVWDLSKEQDAKDALMSKIKAMESKLLVGGKNIMDHTNEQQKMLEQRRQEIAEQKWREREMQQQVERRDEETLELRDTFTSLRQEVELKTKKLKKLFAKLQSVKAETQDVQDEHVKERQELEQTQNELTRELKLKYLTMENFIPPEVRSRLMERAYFDEEEEQWRLQPIVRNPGAQQLKRPVSAVGYKRPVSQTACATVRCWGNPRFRAENVMFVELELSSRTTRDYVAPRGRRSAPCARDSPGQGASQQQQQQPHAASRGGSSSSSNGSGSSSSSSGAAGASESSEWEMRRSKSRTKHSRRPVSAMSLLPIPISALGVRSRHSQIYPSSASAIAYQQSSSASQSYPQPSAVLQGYPQFSALQGYPQSSAIPAYSQSPASQGFSSPLLPHAHLPT
ncbi:kinesin-like protein KIF3B [Petromyzon marinus]|uniref:kinesin-like protein KIF3B n=1 Tax=Petromyzon marinus TaxID=7757 RepID=UPI003F714413